MRCLANTAGSPVFLRMAGWEGMLLYPMRLIDFGVIEREILRAKADELSFPTVDPETNLKLQTEVARQTIVPLNKLIREAKSTYLPLSIWLCINNRPTAGSQSVPYSEVESLCNGEHRETVRSWFMEANGLNHTGSLETYIGPIPIQYTAYLSEADPKSRSNQRNPKGVPRDNSAESCHNWPDWRTVVHQLMQSLHCLPTEVAMMSLPQVMYSARMFVDKIDKSDRKGFMEWQRQRAMVKQTTKEISDSVLRELSMRLDD